MRKGLINWLRERSQYVSIGFFFLWGLLLSIFSGGMGTIWTIPILLLTHAASGLGIYFGIFKNESGKRGILGITLNSLSMIYNLSIDMLYIIL